VELLALMLVHALDVLLQQWQENLLHTQELDILEAQPHQFVNEVHHLL